MANRPGLRMWADALLKGGLDALLLQFRADGLTIDQMTRELHDRDIEVSRESVRKWLSLAEAA
jgi:hypothetical protein